jgi:NAD(P)-dependent dehydrogenase (short-subunit alcohol dehydrogenase family)
VGLELDGRVTAVTGGSSGIGFGVARRFLAEGAKVVIADIDEERGREAALSLGPNAAFARTDVSDPGQVKALISFAVDTYGGLDVMVNNAGIGGARHPSLLDDDFADFHKVMAINLLGVMTGTREAARHMATKGGGSIISISSIGGVQAAPSQWAYHTSKAAVIMFSKSAAIDLGRFGIRVNCIAPGNIETPILEQTMVSHLPEEERSEAMSRIRAFIIAKQPLPLQGSIEDLAEAVLFLASDRSRYVTGTLLPVDGGLLAGAPPRSGGIEDLRKARPPG